MKKRIGVVAVVIRERKKAVDRLNSLLSEHSQIIIGRMGRPYKEQDMSVMAIIVEGTTDEIGALTGKLGNLPGITLKTALTTCETD